MARICVILIFGSLAAAGCTSSSASGGGSPTTSDIPNKSTDDRRTGDKNSKPTVTTKRANPLAGKWTVTKASEHWADHVAKQAIVEFHADGATPNAGSMSITNNNNVVTTEGDYLWQGAGFVFVAKFLHPDGTRNGCGAQVKIEKMTNDEIVADEFTLKRIK